MKANIVPGGKTNYDIFSGCIIYLCKANITKTRFSLFENKIKSNGGLFICSSHDKCITHIGIEDSLCNDLSNCLCILKKAGFTEAVLIDVKVVKVGWICECLKQKQKVDIKSFEIVLPLKQHLAHGECISSNKIIEEAEHCQSDNLAAPEPKKVKKDTVDNSKYTCSQASFNERELSKNLIIVNELQKLADAFRNHGDQWRSYSYEKAIRAIKNYNKEITSYEEAKQIPNIGEKMALKVKEILEEGHLRKVDEICGDEKCKVLELFSGIWGAGPATVQAWYRKGYRTLEDIETKAKLTSQQKTGLKYYNEIQEKMPRNEVEEIANVIKEHALSIDQSLKVVICGSYRRGKNLCGDVDILLIKPDNLNSDILYLMHKEMKKTGFLTDDLTTLQENGKDRKYLGMCKLPGENRKHRRLDIFVVPESESACAIMHYTGSALFNRSIRLLAIRKGMCLSEHALSTDVLRVGNDVKNAGVVLPTPTEESIFKQLSLEYRPPEQRDH